MFTDLQKQRSVDIVSRSTINGFVNNTAFSGKIIAIISTGRGGYSACAFDQLPPHFTPGTIGTHS